ncbi:MAG: carbohydrate kinase family protein [Bryobacterales bacterium]|nr:carbohydrate kinase family protein [Bryobacterales bacterium]
MAFALKSDCRLVVSGNLVRDTIVRPVEQLDFGATLWVDSMSSSIGGNGANTAFTIGAFGVPVALISECGDDDPGALSLKELRHAGVDTWVAERLGQSTAQTIAIVNRRGERAFLHSPGVNRTAMAGPIEFAGTHGSGDWHYHLANPFALPAFRPFAAESLKAARTRGATTSLDTGWDSQGRWLQDLEECLPLLDWFFVNDREGAQLTGETEAGRIVTALHRHGAHRVILKLGEQGCLLSDEDDRELVAAFRVEAVDTTGAGDTFSGGFLTGLVRGMQPLEAARFACAVAALSTTEPGSVRGLLPYEDTLRWMAEFDAAL